MNSITLALAFGCSLIFSHPNTQATADYGDKDTGVFYDRVEAVDAKQQTHLLGQADKNANHFTVGSDFHVGASPDKLYAAYLEHTAGAGHDIDEVHFIDAKTCAAIEFVDSQNGAAVSADRLDDGWDSAAGHQQRLLGSTARDKAFAMPKPEYVASHPLDKPAE